MNLVLQPFYTRLLPEQNQETSIWSNADGVIDATFVKGLEQEYKSNLEVNLEESRKRI
jgi:hypothetical protein